jgi:PleD family two-component response regulator/EAL domain-containing protein (putative c-di-GMP-specific phosphodiesterase class I)
MTGSKPIQHSAQPAAADVLPLLEAQWQALQSDWTLDEARRFSTAIEALIDAADDTLASRAADLSAYLAVFADGALIPNPAQLERLRALTAALFGTSPSVATLPAAAVLELPQERSAARSARNTVCLLDLAEATAPGLAGSLIERGFQVRSYRDHAELERYLTEARPAALVMEAPRLRTLPRLTARLGEAQPGTPLGPALIALAPNRDITHRLLAMRSGASLFFAAPIDAYRVALQIEELSGRRDATPYRVLIVDPDRERAAECGRWLAEHGMSARLAPGAAEALAALGEFRPDLLLVDAELPDARGFEFIEAVRQQPEFSVVPIIVAAAEVDDGARFDAIAAGAEDVLQRPLKARHVVGVIRSRVRRAQWLRGQTVQAAGRDPVTGMHLRHTVLERIGALAAQPGAALMLVSIDRPERVREAVGLAGLTRFEQELSQGFREVLAHGDLAAPLRDLAYLVLLTREHRDQVTEVADRLRRKLAGREAGGGDGAHALTVSIGITALDDDPPSIDARVARAEAASMAAARVGGNRVLWYEPVEYGLVSRSPELAVRAVLSRPWHDANCRIEFRPLLPLAGKLSGQFDFIFALVGTEDRNARADYAEYAPVARELDQLAALEARRLDAALAARERSLALGRQIRLFVPMLADALIDREFVAAQLAALEQRQLSGSGLVIELSGAELLDHRDALREPLQRLRGVGVRVGISDYGRDWAAVHVLNTLPLDYLRLDPELVLTTTSDKSVSSTLLALVRKAHQLGAAVIAPGIDSIDRAHLLLRLGIDYGAGDGLGRAGPEPEFDFSRPIW